MGGSGEEGDIVFEDKDVEMNVDEGRMNMNKVGEMGADRTESNIRLRWGYSNVKGG